MSDITLISERIASAVYFITGFFSDLEPLKWKMRQVASEIATFDKTVKMESRKTILDLVSFLKVAKSAGLISTPNYELIDGEISRYLADLDISTDISPILPTLLPVIKDSEHQLPDVIKVQPQEARPALRDFGAVSVKKSSRQSIIIGLLKRKKEVMIKDITPLIDGCSEKTVQRELLSMVKQGILRKIGEKRWSRYTLV